MKFLIGADYRIAQNLLTPFFREIHNTGNLVCTPLLDDINTRFAVTAAAN
jgi:hypothetical protein